jgi:hypothetical protein
VDTNPRVGHLRLRAASSRDLDLIQHLGDNFNDRQVIVDDEDGWLHRFLHANALSEQHP